MKKYKKLFILILAICLNFVLLNEFAINIQANDYITYNLNNPPPVTGSLLSSHKVASETQFWRHSGGEWSYTPILGEGTKRISSDEMNQILQAQTSNEDFVISANLPGAVVNYLNSGKDNLKVKIRETNNKDYVYSDARNRFQYRIDVASRKIYLKFQPQFNVEQGRDFWAGSEHEGVIPSLPVVQEGYGNAMFAVYTRNPRASIGELEYGLDDPRKLQDPDEIRLSGSDGLLQDNKTYIFSNNVEFQGKDYQIGDGNFKGGGAMGIEFFFSFDVEYYAGFDGDFEIHIDGQNKTDSNHNVEIPDTDYGRRTYNPTLKYVGPTEGISKVEWKDNFGFTFTANAPNFSTQGRAIGDEYPGQKNTYNMKVYYTNGDIYPGTGEG